MRYQRLAKRIPVVLSAVEVSSIVAVARATTWKTGPRSSSPMATGYLPPK